MSVYKGKTYIKGLAALSLAALFAFPAALPVLAGTNLEEKAKYEKFLETKVEDVLQNLLGPNKAKVMIQADLDFSQKESITQGSAKGGDSSAFKWANINQAAETSQQELLPGFPVESRLNMNADSNFSRELQFPPSMIKRLTVSLVLSESVADADAQKLRVVVESLLELEAKRGDDIRILKAKFAPIWYTPEMMSILTRYGIVAVIAILGMAIVAFGFLKMAGAMNNMAGANQSKISMDMAGNPTMGVAGADGLPALEGPEGAEGGAKGADGLPETVASTDNVVFTIPPAKLGILVNMLAKESPGDVALVAIHLPPDQRNRFLASFPPEKTSEVIASITKVRFIDPEMIAKIKEELERRINSAIGGYDKALELMGGVDLKAKKAIYENLESKHPEVAAKVRPTLVFIEDIAKFEDRELSILIGTIAVDQLATAMWRVPENVRPRIKSQMTERSWMMVEQTMKYGKPSEAKMDKAVEEIIASVWKLIAAGRVKNPNLVKEGEEVVAAGPVSGPMASPPPPGTPAQIATAPAAPKA